MRTRCGSRSWRSRLGRTLRFPTSASSANNATLEANLVGPFRDGLRDLGYVEGKNIVIEYRWAEGDYARFPALISELVVAKVELIVTAGTPATLALKKATTSIPVVMIAVGDPVGTGIVPRCACLAATSPA